MSESPASPLVSKLERLSPLTETDRRAVADLVDDEIWLAEGQNLCAEGRAPDAVCALLAGWACRCKDFRDGRRQIIALLTPGDLIGCDEAGASRKADHAVRALTRVRVAWIPRPRLRATLAEHRGLASAVRMAVAMEEAILRAWLVNLGQRPAYQRMAFFLCEMAERVSGGTGGAERFALPLTQQTLACVLGLTPVHVNRVLQRLRSEGLVDFHNGMVTMRDPVRTWALAGFDNEYLVA
ncbi:MAG: Crp/Fnr family transcriptional regulator [Caulobacteraceae bacterium]